MAVFRTVDGDALVLTNAFNAMRAGMGTYLPPALTLDQFLAAWKSAPRAFASDDGFLGLSDEGNPQGAAMVVLCQFDDGPVQALFGEHLKKLSRELLKAWNLVVIRAVADTEKADRLLTLAGFTQDGVIRRAVPDEKGVLQDLGMYSLTKDDL